MTRSCEKLASNFSSRCACIDLHMAWSLGYDGRTEYGKLLANRSRSWLVAYGGGVMSAMDSTLVADDMLYI